MLPYKIMKNNKSVVCLAHIQYYLPTILLWPVYMAINVVTWRNNKKTVNLISSLALSCSLWSLHLLSLSDLSGCQLYLKLKLRTEKYIRCLKWVFLPQWVGVWSPSLAGYEIHGCICEVNKHHLKWMTNGIFDK